jgi:glycosyltransferase involved in cell wall biosynthesis
MTKVLVISFIQPFPADDGKKAALQGLVRYFLSRPRTRVDYMLLRGTGPSQSPAAQMTFHPLSDRRRLTYPLTAVVRSVVRQQPLQQTLVYSDALGRAIRRQMAALEPDLVIYDTFRVGQFVDRPRTLLGRAQHVLYLDDLFSVRYETMLRAMDQYPCVRVEPLGNFAVHLPRAYRPLLNARPLCRYLLRREMELVKRVEIAAAAQFDVSMLANRAEVALLRQRSARANIATLPITLPDGAPHPRLRNYQGNPEFVFIGSLNVAHNQCSLAHFITNVLGECVRSIPGIKLRIIGQKPSADLRRLFARHAETIEWTPWVADLGEVFARCSAMLTPLLFGSGVKVKTLAALQHALPVVSTRFGAEGILENPNDACGIVVDDDLQRFPQHMRALLDPQENSRLSRAAREYYAAHCSAEATARQYEALFGL